MQETDETPFFAILNTTDFATRNGCLHHDVIAEPLYITGCAKSYHTSPVPALQTASCIGFLVGMTWLICVLCLFVTAGGAGHSPAWKRR